MNGIIPPDEWKHNPAINDKFNDSVALWLASKAVIPPTYWNHDP